MTYSETYFKKTVKNKILLWVYKRLNGLARWFMYRCDHHDCNKCVYNDTYGCMRNWYDGNCLFEEVN